MNHHHQLFPFSLDVSGATLILSLPQDASRVGCLPAVNAEAKSVGSLGLLESPSYLGVFFPSLNDSVEDILYGQSLFDDGFCSKVPSADGSESSEFDLNFLPSSPESLDFVDVIATDPEMLAHSIEGLSTPITFGPNSIIKDSCVIENVKVEQAVGDPEVALNLIKQLNADRPVAFLGAPMVQHNYGDDYGPVNILPIGGAPLIPDQTQAASAAFQLMSAAPEDSMSFHVDSFFSDSNKTETSTVNDISNTQESPSHAPTLRDLIAVPSVRHVVWPGSPASSDGGSSASLDAIAFGDVVVPQQSGSLVIRPEKRQRKKEQNKNAALKYRQKKRSEQGNFLSECLETERRNAELKLRVNEITREINYLKGLLLEISVA